MAYITVYEQSILGIGLSTWAIIFLILVIMVMGFAMYLGYSKLGPVEGYFWTALFGAGDDKDIGIIFQNHRVSFKRLRYFSGVFSALGMTWTAKKTEHHLFGECNAELLVDYWGLTLDPKINIATLDFINAWNSDDEPEFMFEPDFTWLPKKADRAPITNFDTLYAAIEKCPSDAAIRMRAFSYVPVYDLQRYYPRNLTASDLTGYQEAMKKVTDEKAQSPSTNYLPIICFIAGVLLGVGIMFLK